MKLWKKGLGRYFLTQVVEVWLWFLLFFFYLFLSTLIYSRSGITYWHIILFMWIIGNGIGLLILRRVAHTAKNHTIEHRKEAAKTVEEYANLAQMVTDENYILADMTDSLKQGTRRLLYSFLYIGFFACYSAIGFTSCLIKQNIQNSNALTGYSVFELGFIFWTESNAFKIYLLAGLIITIHLIGYQFIKVLRNKMDKFVFGPYYFTKKDDEQVTAMPVN